MHTYTYIYTGSPTDDVEDGDVRTSTTANRESLTRRGSFFGHTNLNDIYEDKYEAISIRYNCTFRPAPAGLRGVEVCIPNPPKNDTAEPENSRSGMDDRNPKNDENSGLGTPFVPKPNLTDLFYKIRVAGKQNELYADECYVMHERKTK